MVARLQICLQNGVRVWPKSLVVQLDYSMETGIQAIKYSSSEAALLIIYIYKIYKQLRNFVWRY